MNTKTFMIVVATAFTVVKCKLINKEKIFLTDVRKPKKSLNYSSYYNRLL